LLKLRDSSREAATADSRGRKPTEYEPKHDPRAAKRRQQAVIQIAVAASRLESSFKVHCLRADARSYLLPPLRG
jgi:hypothetical protein